MLKLTKLQFFKILTVYTLLALAALCCYNIKTLLGPARKRPFQCCDKSIQKPFVNDTVPPKQLNILGIYFPLVLLALCELINSVAKRKSVNKLSWLLKYALKSVVILTIFLIGLAVERLYKNVAKIKMARLRPNFVTVCDPVGRDGLKCNGADDTTIIDEYDCSSNSYPSWAVNTAFVSFPSGHTSLTSYSMVFLICYLHLLYLKLKRFQTSFSLLILITQAMCFFIILFVGISRILDFKHHWSDVCAGFIGGSSIALVLIYYLKNQLVYIEKWILEVTDQAMEDVETVQTDYVNRNKTEKSETCTIEMIMQ